MRRWILAAAVAAASASPAAAQQTDLARPCADLPSQQAQDYCVVVAQAVKSAHPQLGILLAGGNPTLGTAGAGGLRLGILPRVSATAKANLVFVELPDILAQQAGQTAADLNERIGIPAPALSGTVSVGVFPGLSVAPTVGGIGAIDLLGSATWLPFKALGVEGFDTENAEEFAFGGGVRLGLLGESFTTPGVSVSVMYRSLGETKFGDACPSDAQFTTTSGGDGYEVRRGRCLGDGDLGDIQIEVENWSTRAAVSKRLLGVGLAAGVGYDQFSSDEVALSVHVPSSLLQENYYNVSGLALDQDRWSAFVNGSYTALVATLAVEAGWLQGADALPAFDEGFQSEFDPGAGTFFGSVGLRLAF